MHEMPAGPDQLFVTYESGDDGGDASTGYFVQEAVAPDAARRSDEGWDIVSSSIFAVRQTGTAGNILFQSGGQYATQLNAVVLYRRRLGRGGFGTVRGVGARPAVPAMARPSS